MRTLIASTSLVAALVATSPAALAQAAPVCLKSTSGMANCVFQTIAQCEVAKGVNVTAQCIPRSQAGSRLTPAGTTGQRSSGQGSPSPRPSPSR
jgi:hypothetical protein